MTYRLLILLSFLPLSLFAQDKAKPASAAAVPKDTAAARMLQGVTIFSSKNNSVSPVQTLSGVALEKMNSLSVADAVRFFSGVQLKDYGGLGGLKTLNVRSMGTNHVGVFYDGIQLGNAQNGTVDLGRFSLDNIEQIDLYNAQKGAILQPAKGFSAASSIYLQSRKPIFHEGETTHGKVAIKTGSFGMVNPSVRLEQKISSNLSAVISSEWLHGNGRYKFRYTNGTYDTTAVRENAGIDASRVEGGLYGQFKDSSTWHAKVYYYNSTRGLPGAIVSNKFYNGQHQWDRNLFVQTSYNKKFGKRYTMLLNAKYMYDYVRYLDTSIITDYGPLMNRYRQHEYYISSANQYKLTSFWDVALSADFQLNEMTAVNLDHFAIPTRYTTLAAAATQLHLGQVEMQGNLLATFINEKTKLYSSGHDYSALRPTILVSWQPFRLEDLKLRAFYKSIFRMPTFNDMYYSTVGNPDLKPEHTRQYNAGIGYTRNSKGFLQFFSLQTDVYYSHVKDKIVAAPGRNFQWMMQNIGGVDIYGADASVQLSPRLLNQVQTDFSVKYTYQKALDVTDPQEVNYKDQIAYVPVHSGSFIAHASWNKWDINYSFIYVGERYFLNTNVPLYYLEPWYTSDLSVSTSFLFKHKLIKLTGELNNVFNQYYDVVINYPMPGRYYRLTASINF
ncbi:TonB-dependent receptor [Chitinophaga pinensis]|uniref:TonB-dependent receptor n=1 Tax=Chitinophaga pinensis (strain ATCC 43595 / DSM 2588 / LMG 13176 / NBRC 15968 / NCIMB 11800 / UQM 2034) TaxID=485918 RepID=A0A979G662_CHIPD|nr:TonB-dependent receptor [Chitinophaga pinensis]ACU61403.1 TonB-dependent receptor [Chitinophaga pinensis DSM 2588]